MVEMTFRCYLEIPLYTAALVLTIGTTCGTLLNQEIVNPSPTDPYCVPNSYPADCTKEDNPDCRGGEGRGAFYSLFFTSISIATFTLFVTMTLIIHKFYRNERKLRKAVKDEQIQEDDDYFEALLYAQKASGIITRQALLYIAAFVITWIFGIFELLWLMEVIKLTDRCGRTLSILRVIFHPLQGLFNLMIFVYHKVHTLRTRNVDENLTVSEAFAEIFLCPSEMEYQAVFSNLNMAVDNYIDSLSLGTTRNSSTKRRETKNQELEMVSAGDMEQSVVGVRRRGTIPPQQEPSVGGISLSDAQSGNDGRDADMSSHAVSSTNVRSLDSAGIRPAPSIEFFDDNDMSYSENQTVKDELSGFSFGSATVK